ncbi:MAG: pyridoxamine 5'-phosphate oxidase family protein, partial [Deltaproteobacteria bacterium]|nr:pyridoxamine 5'-phosphate oxidase family protein [Deltaproteobacteria bacterium]
MSLEEYFNNTKGMGILSTADSDGKVDSAVYARPHFMEDGTLALIMRDRLSHHNLQSNPHATYLYKEEGSGYRGKRLFMTKVREEQNTELLETLR